MGFHELEKFNDALLAKQVWRLASNHDSLFSRFFKAKFYPNGSFFDAKDNVGSYAWKSILKGCDIIRRGMRWRIGDGSSVQIYQDKWLPGFDHDSITSPIVEITSDATVSILIDHDLYQWRKDEVERLFIPEEALIIKAIPLSFSNKRDMIFWPRS